MLIVHILLIPTFRLFQWMTSWDVKDVPFLIVVSHLVHATTNFIYLCLTHYVIEKSKIARKR